jgi:hypothetical protein
LHVLIRSIIKARAKRIKEVFNKLIHDIYVEQASRTSLASNMKLSSKKDQVLINMIQARDGCGLGLIKYKHEFCTLFLFNFGFKLVRCVNLI